MVKANIIHLRLNKLDEYLAILQELQQYTFEEFVAEPERYGSAERFLHLAIESCTDMGNHVIADENLGVVTSYRDIPTILEEKGYISVELRETWIAMIGFRNILVHDYTDIDQKLVYDALKNRLGDFLKLRKVFAQFL